MKSEWLKQWLSKQYSNKEELINWTLNAPMWEYKSGNFSSKMKSWFQPSNEDFLAMRKDVEIRTEHLKLKWLEIHCVFERMNMSAEDQEWYKNRMKEYKLENNIKH